MTDPTQALAARGLSKIYYTGPSRVRTLVDVLTARSTSIEDESAVWALHGVSFSVERGRSLGIIGRNGAGKSTLLRILAGTASPTQGSVETRCRVLGLLDLGVGFNRFETGRENAERALVLQGGMTRKEARGRMREIEQFAAIGSFFDQPIRTYSDGMRLRVAFAAITLLEPEILITDEILAVGDEVFQSKCSRWFDRFLANGGTLVLCSHELSRIQELCGTTLWLDAGRVREVGDTRGVLHAYRTAMGGALEEERKDGVPHAIGESFGLPCEVVALRLYDERGQEVNQISSDANAVVEVDIAAAAGPPHVHIGITKLDLTPVYGVSSDMEETTPEDLGGGRYRYRLELVRLPLCAGSYRLRAHALDATATRLYDTVEKPFVVDGDDANAGLVRFDWRWSFEGTA